MESGSSGETVLAAANQLLAHLRQYPDAASKKPSALAKEFNLEERFVADVLQNVRSAPRVEVEREDDGPGLLTRLWGGVREAWMRVTSRPLPFVIVTFVLCLAIGIIGSQANRAAGAQPISVGTGVDQGPGNVTGTVSASGAYIALAIVITFFLHMTVYYRHRGSRNAVYGGIFLWLALTAMVAGDRFLHPDSLFDGNPLIGILFGSIGMFMLALMYTGAGALASIVGGYFYIRRQDRDEHNLSRHELIERYFELQERLATTAYPRAGEGPGFFRSALIEGYRQNPYIPNLVFGAIISFLSFLGSAVARFDPDSTGPHLSIWLFGLLLVGISAFLFYIFQGYLAKTASRVFLGILAFHAGEWVIRGVIFAVDILGPKVGLNFKVPSEYIAQTLGNPEIYVGDLLNLGMMTAVSYAGYLGARVQDRALREHNLARNDQATLLGEMVRLQWRLSNDAGQVCILVVDAARSSEMKADADPLLVEYTFREYQEWIGRMCAEFGGKVQSTAGDGAVIAFNTADSALKAAKRLQTDIYRFNKDENRLQRPFRLRIGLHSGEVAGDVGKVQFTEVIDIAAHMEAAAPIGGITVSDTVAELLAGEGLIDLNREIDGHRVLMVANPSE